VIETTELREEIELTGERKIETIALHPHAYRTSHQLASVDIVYADGSSESLVLKELGPESLIDRTGAAPSFTRDPMREIAVYRDVLARAGLGTATLRCAHVDAVRRSFWLLIERVEATELWQLESLDAWCSVATWLADMHSRLRDASSGHLVRWTPGHARSWIARANQRCPDPAVRAAASRSGDLIERLLALPVGFIHGELYASNVLVDEASGRICPVDWEMAGVGPLLLDLAALTSGAWTEHERREIAAAYWRRAGSAASFDEFLADLDVCRLQIALQWLGWSDDWVPPPEHAHDWLADVRMLVEQVGVA
jgi:Phosphotransferase enzyme family